MGVGVIGLGEYRLFSSSCNKLMEERRMRRARIVGSCLLKDGSGRRSLLSTSTSILLLLAATNPAPEPDSRKALLDKYLEKSKENKAKNDKERLDDYYKRNYKDYFDFIEGFLKNKKEELTESEKGILEWLQTNNKGRSRIVLRRYMKTPLRMLSKVRDFYTKSFNDFSALLPYGAVMGYPAPLIYNLPVNPVCFNQLMISSKEHHDYDQHLHHDQVLQGIMSTKLVSLTSYNQAHVESKMKPTNFRVRIRIDEDKSCCFSSDVKFNLQNYYSSKM